jgi:CRP-like cAMP-binding protein
MGASMPDQDSPSLAKYLAKLERRALLSPEAREAFLAMPKQARDYAPYRDIVREGDRPTRASFIESGLISRYKTLRSGARQIMSFHIPGDFFLLTYNPHWLWSLTTVSERIR